MLKVKCRTNKGKHTLNLPQHWGEVSVEQYQRIIKERDGADPVKLFSILTSLEANDVKNFLVNRPATALSFRPVKYYISNVSAEVYVLQIS